MIRRTIVDTSSRVPIAVRAALLLLSLPIFADRARAASDVRVDFTLNTTDDNREPLTENRYYYVYRPDGLSKATPVPVVLVMEAVPGSGPAGQRELRGVIHIGFLSSKKILSPDRKTSRL